MAPFEEVSGSRASAVAEDRAQHVGLGGVVVRRAGAVDVDEIDAGGARPASASAASTARAMPAPCGSGAVM